MGEETDDFGTAVEAKLQAEFACPERDAERVAGAVTRLRESAEGPDWSSSFLVERLTDAPKSHSVPEKWNWLLEHVGRYSDGDTPDLDEYRIET
jgi:hypothetical protein